MMIFKDRKPRIATLATAALMAGVVSLWGGASHAMGGGESHTRDKGEDKAGSTIGTEISDIVWGAEDAPITLIEYASYTCPHCGTFHESVFDDLKRDYIDTGKVRFVYREVYFDRYGLWAAMVARCEGGDRYLAVQSQLYKKQQDWAGESNANDVVDKLKKIGLSVGMEGSAIDACMQDGEAAGKMIDHARVGQEEYDIPGTPTLVLNGTLHSNMSYSALSSLLDKNLAQ